MKEPFITFQTPDHAGEPSGEESDKTARLLAHANINGTDFHVEAYAVFEDEIIGQGVADFSFDPEWQAICALQPDGGAFRTTEINGRDYVIVMTPFPT